MIIGLHGAAGCGKDTLASYLVSHPELYGSWSIYRMAGPLKAGLSAMFNIPMEDIENPDLKNSSDYKFGKSIRYMAQTLGTEWGRNMIANDVWIQMAKENITSLLGMRDVVVTDVRFDNEAETIREMGGKIIHIIRPMNPHTISVESGGVSSHVSEKILPAHLIDCTIFNDTTVDELYGKFMRNILEWI